MTWLTRFLVALSLLVGLSAAPPARAANMLANRGQVDLILASDMNPAEHAAIHQAAQVWNTLVGRPVLLLVDHEPAVGTHDQVFYVVSVLGYDEPGTLAVTYRAYDKSYVSYLEPLRSKPEILRRVLIHELGHVLGLEHAETPDSVMFPSIGEADLPTRPEVLYLRSLWAF